MMAGIGNLTGFRLHSYTAALDPNRQNRNSDEKIM